MLPAQSGLASALAPVAAELDLDFEGSATLPDVPRHPADWPRLAMLQTWNDTQSAGWVRMIFDEQKIPYTVIMDEDVRKGGLHARFDVVLYPDTDRSLKDIVQRHRSQVRPPRLHPDARSSRATARPPRRRTSPVG